MLLIEMTGDTEAEVLSKIETLKADLDRKGLGYYTLVTTDAAQQRDMWRMREAGQGLITSVRGAAQGRRPSSRTRPWRRRSCRSSSSASRRSSSANNTEAAYYGHASVGCLHIRPMVNLKTTKGLDQMEKIARGGRRPRARVRRQPQRRARRRHRARRVHGAHVRPDAVQRLQRGEARPSTRTACSTPARSSRRPASARTCAWSPTRRPGSPSPTSTSAPRTASYGAADQCNGQGACRKHEGGMCPSLHGHAGRGAQHPRPRQPAAPGDDRRAAARRAGRRPPARGPGPLRRVQGVQGRVPDRRRHGQAQVRGAGPAQQRARHAPARAALRQHRHAGQADVAIRADCQRCCRSRRRCVR